MEVENVFEGFGLMVNRGLIDPNYISDMISDTTKSTWEHIRAFVYEYRRRHNDPYFCEWAEVLYKVVSKIEKQPGYLRVTTKS